MIADTWSQKKPKLPAPHQVTREIWKTTVEKKITSKRSLIYHSWVTLSATLLGFALGTVLGIALAVGIVFNRTMDMSVMPWVITSQTIPILAVAPMIIVVLNAVGISRSAAQGDHFDVFVVLSSGRWHGQRAARAQIICSLIKCAHGTRAGAQTFWRLRLPSSMPYLFTSLKIAMAAAIVGAIVGELPTGAVAGLGARLLAGSYYGQTIQIWSALLVAAALAASLGGHHWPYPAHRAQPHGDGAMSWLIAGAVGFGHWDGTPTCASQLCQNRARRRFWCQLSSV